MLIKRRNRIREGLVLFATNFGPGNRKWATMTLRAVLLGWTLLACNGCSTNDSPPVQTVVVNSLEDMEQPPAGTMTLRAAIEQAGPG